MSGTTIILLRHGETEANSKGVLQGQSESPLTHAGREQAAQLGIGLRMQHLAMPLCITAYASDLSRAHDTAQAVLDELNKDKKGRSITLACDARLRERRLGPFQGRSAAECHRLHPRLWHAFNAGSEDDVRGCDEPGAADNGGVELNDEMMRRAATVMGEIAAAHPGEAVLVTSHGGFIHTAVCALTGLSAHEVPHIGNCSVTTLVAPAGSARGDMKTPWQVIAIGEAPGGGRCHDAGLNVDLGLRRP